LPGGGGAPGAPAAHETAPGAWGFGEEGEAGIGFAEHGAIQHDGGFGPFQTD
jgi:hypothetical protein